MVETQSEQYHAVTVPVMQQINHVTTVRQANFVPPIYFKRFSINGHSFETNRHAQDKFNLIYILQPIFETPRTHAVIQTKAPSLALTFTETKSNLMESTNSQQNY